MDPWSSIPNRAGSISTAPSPREHDLLVRIVGHSCAKTTPRSGCPGRAPTAALPYGWRPCWSPYARRCQSLRSLNCLASATGASGAPSIITSILACFTISTPSMCSIPAKGRKARVVAQFADAFEAHGTCAGNSCAVCMDMSASYQAGVCEHLPWTAITFDEFHVIQLVNRAVNAVRRQKVKRPWSGGVHAISGSRTSRHGVIGK